jgi:hypothetical protein
MGDAADDMYDMEMDWLDHGEWCEKHKRWYLGGTIGMCPQCEDGELGEEE